VLFVIRTAGPPWSNRPSVPLMMTTVVVVLVGGFLPFSALAQPLGFVPLPRGFFIFLAAATITYLLLVELIKRRLIGRLFVR
jgi:Mg2+-importing ATPase